MSKNSCNCPRPPGGVVVCEADQLAICRIRYGQLETECVDPPIKFRAGKTFSTADRLIYLNWALTEITGQERLIGQDLDPMDLIILRRGVYQDPITAGIIHFTLPPFLDEIPGPRWGPIGGVNPPFRFPPFADR